MQLLPNQESDEEAETTRREVLEKTEQNQSELAGEAAALYTEVDALDSKLGALVGRHYS